MGTLMEKQQKIQHDLQQLGWDVEDKGEYLIVHESGIPYLFIECVDNLVKKLTDEDFEFFVQVNSIHQNSFFALTDGEVAKVYAFGFGDPIRLDYIQTIEQFLSYSPEQLALEDMYRRIHSIEFLQDEAVVQEFMAQAFISETTEVL